MKEVYNANRDQLEKTISEWIVDVVVQTQKIKEKVVIGLPGGRSIVGVLKQILSLPFGEIKWSNVHFFFVDERLVPLSHEDSNFLLIKKNFFDILLEKQIISNANIHPFNIDLYGEDTSLYQKELDAIQNYFDLLILGVGEDGHVASLFPNHAGLENDQSEFITVDDSPKPPSKRISISKEQLLEGKNIALLFLGEGKKEALKQFKNSEINYQNCPCKLALVASESEPDKGMIFTDINLS